jgi:thiamine transport system permease protein
MRRRWPERLGVVVLAAVPLAALLVFFVLPVGGMLARGLWPEGRFDPGGVLEVLTRSRTHEVLWVTV